MIKTRSCTWLRRPDGRPNTQSEVTGDPICCSLHCGHLGALVTSKAQTPKSHTPLPDKAETCLYNAAPTLARAPHSLMTPDIQSPLSSRSFSWNMGFCFQSLPRSSGSSCVSGPHQPSWRQNLYAYAWSFPYPISIQFSLNSKPPS